MVHRRYFFIFLASVFLLAGFLAHGKKKYRGLPRTEVGLMNNVLGCLQNKDTLGYFYLFPPFDTLWRMVMHNPDKSPETQKALNMLKEHPQSLIQFDPAYNHHIIGGFSEVLRKGEDSGIHWNSIVLQRYELVQQPATRDLIGYDKIVPERFKGYMFVRDLLGRLTFCITITEIQKIRGYFFGGQVINILEASSVDEYLRKEEDERKYFAWLAEHPQTDTATDSTKQDSLHTTDSSEIKGKLSLSVVNQTEEDKSKNRKEVVDRKYYEGKFDQDIPVKLFIRYMKDARSSAIVAYDGLYKFGDQTSYAQLTITKNKEGKWIMEDDISVMELELAGKTYTGTWTNNENQTGYDAVLKQTDIPPKKLEQLDNILERGLAGSVSETVEGKEKKKEKENTDEVDKQERKRQKKEQRKIRRQYRTNADD